MEKYLSFVKKDGSKIAAKAFIPNENGPFPTVIFAHGFNGNYCTLEHHGDGFSDNKIACIFFDFCGGGMETHSDGTLEDMTIFTEIDDLETVLTAVKELDFVDENKVFLQGESMGGFVSAYVAGKNPNAVKALILWYPAFVMPDDSKKRLEAGDNTCFGLKLNPDFNSLAASIDIFEIIKGYKGNVKLIHGDADSIVPIEYSIRAQSVYDNAELVTIKDAGHGFDGADSELARMESVKFILENL